MLTLSDWLSTVALIIRPQRREFGAALGNIIFAPPSLCLKNRDIKGYSKVQDDFKTLFDILSGYDYGNNTTGNLYL
ncbi:MAG: hypothetical protein AAFZ92_03545 [Pseudomonadota bacterium]